MTIKNSVDAAIELSLTVEQEVRYNFNFRCVLAEIHQDNPVLFAALETAMDKVASHREHKEIYALRSEGVPICDVEKHLDQKENANQFSQSVRNRTKKLFT